MAQKSFYTAVALALMSAVWLLATGEAQAQSAIGATAPPSPNYYVSGDDATGVTAALYPSPRPVPPLVGHTYITYEPLAPHEFLYPHHRTYVRNHPDGSRTRTRVTWNRCPEFGPTLMSSVPALRSPTGNSFEGSMSLSRP